MADPGYVVSVVRSHLTPDYRPSGSDVAGLGIFRLGSGATFDRHFHDSVEYWLIYAGKAKAAIEDELYYIQAGDVICTPTGLVHDILEIYEPLEGFYLEEGVPPGGRLGHLHRSDEDAAGHPVPLKELPADFPVAAITAD
jgi:mannose-6-phosphate isomerase-like protein (cupin superfamily)